MRRGAGFWEGPGLVLGCLGLGVAGGLLLFALIAGPALLRGVALVILGLAAIWARRGFGDYAYTKAQYGYIWPRDPEEMKPNAELESSFMTGFAVAVGAALIVGGLVLIVAAID